MLPHKLLRFVSRVVLGAYGMQVVAPVVQASETEQRRSFTPSSLAHEIDLVERLAQIRKPFKPVATSTASVAPSSQSLVPQLPTLSIRLKHLSGMAEPTYRLSITQTRDLGSQTDDYPWRGNYSLRTLKASAGSLLKHPWHHYVDIHLSEEGKLQLKSKPLGQEEGQEDQKLSYQSYNYCIHTVGDVHLSNLFTSGKIEVRKAGAVSAEGTVEGQKGIHLKASKTINTRAADLKRPTLLTSQSSVTLRASYMDNENSIVNAPTIAGLLGKRGQRGASLDNTHGKMVATNYLSLVLATELFNEGGKIEATSGRVFVYGGESLLNKKGSVSGATRTNIRVNGYIQNRQGSMGGQGIATIQAASLKNGDGGSAWAKNLTLKNTMVKWDETSRLGADELFRYSLPKTQQVLFYPIYAQGRLELDREGASTENLHLMSDILALKGLKVNVPSTSVLIGGEKYPYWPVNLEARKGFLELKSKSLNPIRTQMYAKAGMRWEVTEKEIHLGRETKIIQPYTVTFHTTALNKTGLTMPSFYMDGLSVLDYFLPNTGQADKMLAWERTCNYVCPKTYSLPSKYSNRTSICTQGTFEVISPEGFHIDHAEMRVEKGWNVTTNVPIKNEGGDIHVQGNARIRSATNSPLLSPVSLYNIRSAGTYRFTVFIPVCLTYPWGQEGRISIGGDLYSGGVENIGSFFFLSGTHHSSGTIIAKPFLPSLAPFFIDGNGIKETFSSTVSAAKAIVIRQGQDPKIEDIVQTPLFIMKYQGKGMIGKAANYRRGPIPPFQQMKKFVDVMRPSAIYRPVMDSLKPWIHQPRVPLSWKVKLPPAVGIGPHGLYLLNDQDKFLFHPLQEIDALPSVLGVQVRRGYLDADHPCTRETYIMGRFQAYELYQKFFAPKAIEGATSSSSSTFGPQPADNPERAISILNDALAKGMTEEELKKIKFMMLYYKGTFEDEKHQQKEVYLPTSWLSKHYDDPMLRNPDGGVFAKILLILGEPGSMLHCLSNLHGEVLLGIDVPHTTLERQNYQYITYHTNTYTKKGSWWSGDKNYSETVAIVNREAQPTTGNMTTGPKGQIAIKSEQLELKNGSHISAGEKGVAWNIDQLLASPAVNQSVASSHSSAGRVSITHHHAVQQILPPVIESEGEMKGRMGDMDVKSLQMMTHGQNKDIKLHVDRNANLLAYHLTQSHGQTVSKEGKATVIRVFFAAKALPCAFLALNGGSVYFTVGRKLYGMAPHFGGKTIDLTAKEHEITSLLMANKLVMTSQTEGLFSTQTTTSSQESPSMLRAIFEGDEIHIRGEKGKLEGAVIKGKALYDDTIEGLILGPVIKMFFYETQTDSKTPLSSSSVGCKGGFETMIPTVLLVDKVVRTINDNKPIIFNSVDWDKNKTKILGTFAETTYQLKQWQTSWAKHEQVIPDAVIPVIALGVALATQGIGVQALAPMINGITAATGLQLSALGITMVNAGFSTLCSQFVTTGVATGDVTQAGKNVLSKDGLTAIGISMASAGLCSKLGQMWNIDMNPSLKEVVNTDVVPAVKPTFTDFLQAQALKAGVNAGLNVAIRGTDPSEAVATALKEAPMQAAAAWAAYNIGDLGFEGKITSDQQDLLHAVVGAAYGAALNPDKPLQGAASGAANAFIAAKTSKLLFDKPEELNAQVEAELKEKGLAATPENKSNILNKKTALPTIAAATATAFIFNDAAVTTTAITTFTNVTENNCIPSITKSLMATEYQPDFIQEKDTFWRDEFVDPSDLYFEMAQEDTNGGGSRATRPLVDPETYNVVQAAHENNLEEFVQDRLVFDEYKKGRRLSGGSRHRLTQRYSTTYYAMQQMEAHKEFAAPGYKRLQHLSSLPYEELKALRMKEMDPQKKFSFSQQTQAEKIIQNEFDMLRSKAFDAQVGAFVPLIAGKVVHSLATANNRAPKPLLTPRTKTVEGLDLAGRVSTNQTTLKSTQNLKVADTSAKATKNTTVLTADKVHSSSSITPLEKPGRVVFDGVEFRSVRDLGHMSEKELRKMLEIGGSPYDMNYIRLDGHHYKQQYHRAPGAFIVEIPAPLHNGANKIQHPLGNKKGIGLTEAQRNDWKKTKKAFNKERAKQELTNRGLLDEKY